MKVSHKKQKQKLKVPRAGRNHRQGFSHTAGCCRDNGGQGGLLSFAPPPKYSQRSCFCVRLKKKLKEKTNSMRFPSQKRLEEV